MRRPTVAAREKKCSARISLACDNSVCVNRTFAGWKPPPHFFSRPQSPVRRGRTGLHENTVALAEDGEAMVSLIAPARYFRDSLTYARGARRSFLGAHASSVPCVSYTLHARCVRSQEKSPHGRGRTQVHENTVPLSSGMVRRRCHNCASRYFRNSERRAGGRWRHRFTPVTFMRDSLSAG